MYYLNYDYAKAIAAEREEGLRKAQRNGTAYEYTPRRRWTFQWWKPERSRTVRPGGIAQAQQ